MKNINNMALTHQYFMQHNFSQTSNELNLLHTIQSMRRLSVLSISGRTSCSHFVEATTVLMTEMSSMSFDIPVLTLKQALCRVGHKTWSPTVKIKPFIS